VLARAVDGQEQASEIGSRLVAALSSDIHVGDQAFKIGVSVGVALYPKDGATSDELMHHADLAMYQAKAADQSGLRFFEATPARRSA